MLIPWVISTETCIRIRNSNDHTSINSYPYIINHYVAYFRSGQGQFTNSEFYNFENNPKITLWMTKLQRQWITYLNAAKHSKGKEKEEESKEEKLEILASTNLKKFLVSIILLGPAPKSENPRVPLDCCSNKTKLSKIR